MTASSPYKVETKHFTLKRKDLPSVPNRRLLRDFIRPALDHRLFGKHLEWVDDGRTFRVLYHHKNANSWREESTSVFQAWDLLKERTKKGDDYFTKSRQRFKAALQKCREIQKVSPPTEKHSEVYRLRVKDDNSKQLRFSPDIVKHPRLKKVTQAFTESGTHFIVENSDRDQVKPYHNMINSPSLSFESPYVSSPREPIHSISVFPMVTSKFENIIDDATTMVQKTTVTQTFHTVPNTSTYTQTLPDSTTNIENIPESTTFRYLCELIDQKPERLSHSWNTSVPIQSFNTKIQDPQCSTTLEEVHHILGEEFVRVLGKEYMRPE